MAHASGEKISPNCLQDKQEKDDVGMKQELEKQNLQLEKPQVCWRSTQTQETP
jgi:hypothetical protein